MGYPYLKNDAKLRINERKAKFICAFPSGSNIGEAKVTNK